MVHPQSRRGVVGGWLTHDRGAGIVIAPITPDKKAAMMRPQIDYAAWRIEAGKDGETETFALGWFEDARLGLEAYADAVARLYDIRLPKPPAKEYVAFDFWRNEFLPPFKDTLAVTLEKDSCNVLAVRPASDVPQLLSTSRHVTQGIVDVTGETWDNATKTLSGTSAVVGNDPYELRIAMPAVGAWQATGVTLSAEDVRAGVTATMAPDGTNLRVRFNSANSRSMHWSVKFGTK